MSIVVKTLVENRWSCVCRSMRRQTRRISRRETVGFQRQGFLLVFTGLVLRAMGSWRRIRLLRIWQRPLNQNYVTTLQSTAVQNARVTSSEQIDCTVTFQTAVYEKGIWKNSVYLCSDKFNAMVTRNEREINNCLCRYENRTTPGKKTLLYTPPIKLSTFPPNLFC